MVMKTLEATNLLAQLDQAKRLCDALAHQLIPLSSAVAAYAEANGLEHPFHRDPLDLDDDELDEDGREIDTSVNGLARDLSLAAFSLREKLDLLTSASAVTP